MNGFDEVVSAGFDARVQAITEGGGVPRKRARSVVTAIRRRRAVRAGAATGASVLAVGALAFAAVNLGPSHTVAPAAFPVPTGGALPWCDLTSYPAVNTEALGGYPYDGRIYVNATDEEYVYVAPDGTTTVLEADADGSYYATTPSGARFRAPVEVATGEGWSHMAWDFTSDGDGIGRAYFVAPGEPAFFTPAGPALLNEWTTPTPDDAPAGVDGAAVLALQLQAIGFLYAMPVAEGAVPAGATLEEVLRWVDGSERVTPLDTPESTSTPVATEDLPGLASVSMRVSGLPDGATYEVTSTFDSTKTWAAACGTQLDYGAPASVEEPFHWGPYFEGPETAGIPVPRGVAEARTRTSSPWRSTPGWGPLPQRLSGVRRTFRPRLDRTPSTATSEPAGS